ncbi:prenyltransferase/squalene oxidase repeat-containing protein [Catellatospora tritici]|uniref:prenyltransferase/squalene oxidase repeat-containing protein n=1 Tax=Catellatospora tritici TaxID=2851566 RepID=UPI001C2CEA38|nr:prenyltransferase/squalene oxidase repeat-containing protein [Catellatospora tritici]MBV1853832.1 terpene cyclase/mutase family protein [Catellatospora tritici]
MPAPRSRAAATLLAAVVAAFTVAAPAVAAGPTPSPTPSLSATSSPSPDPAVSPSGSPAPSPSTSHDPGGEPRALAESTPDLAKGVAYLRAPANLKDGRYYESFPGFPDFGLSIDGAYALAATGADDAKLRAITEFIRTGGVVGDGGFTVDSWLGIGTEWASGGSIGKVALLAQVTGYDPRAFGGHDLIAALKQVTCTGADEATGCAGPGNYTWSASVFSQALGVLAQLRAGQAADATGPLEFLLGLQRSDGSFPSLIPAAAQDRDVDSTAIAAMALDLAGGHEAALEKALAWIAGQQKDHGGFPGAAGDSTNSTALAVQGLSLRADTYAAQLGKAREFLAGQQNGDGGFDVALGAEGSDLRASTQAVCGATGVSFGTLLRDVHALPGGPASPSPSPSGDGGPGLPVTGFPLVATVVTALVLIVVGAMLLVGFRRRAAAGGGR